MFPLSILSQAQLGKYAMSCISIFMWKFICLFITLFSYV